MKFEIPSLNLANANGMRNKHITSVNAIQITLLSETILIHCLHVLTLIKNTFRKRVHTISV